jgi:hypothetical protein
MKGTLNDHLCHAKAIGLEKSAFMLSLGGQMALKGGKFVRDNPERPTPVPFDGEDRRRCHRFIARAERAIFLMGRKGIPLFLFLNEVVRSLCPLGGDNHPLF